MPDILHPANLFVRGEELVIGHRGFMETIVPYINEEDDFIKQYRALVLYILHPRLNYEHDLFKRQGSRFFFIANNQLFFCCFYNLS